MQLRQHAVAVATIAVTAMMAILQAQGGNSLSETDRAQIRQLSARYLETLSGCAAADYAALFAPDGYFESTFRGRIEGNDKLIALVMSEPHCQNKTTRQSGPVPAFDITATPQGAAARILLGNNVGAYDDVYVKTASGWRFKSRIVLTPQELAARQTSTPPAVAR